MAPLHGRARLYERLSRPAQVLPIIDGILENEIRSIIPISPIASLGSSWQLVQGDSAAHCQLPQYDIQAWQG